MTCAGGTCPLSFVLIPGSWKGELCLLNFCLILNNRPVMLTIALVNDRLIRVNVIPKLLKDGDSGRLCPDDAVDSYGDSGLDWSFRGN